MPIWLVLRFTPRTKVTGIMVKVLPILYRLMLEWLYFSPLSSPLVVGMGVAGKLVGVRVRFVRFMTCVSVFLVWLDSISVVVLLETDDEPVVAIALLP